MTLASRRTSFFGLTRSHLAAPVDGPGLAVERVEIPLFQRDYAQGRDDSRARRIRSDFLDVLHAAVVGASEPVGLDFVYGGVDHGTLRPLDGQQRLTTLFLLHWYVASRAGVLDPADGWARFTYATRQSARMFCESLVEHPLPDGEAPSPWITDQPWYLYLWRHDPTIQSMLVMLDDIHDRFADVDPRSAWARLTDEDEPAIWFLLLPLSDLGSDDGEDMSAEDLYIKMNSRGKPLTEFENFKAHFEKTIHWSDRLGEFARKVDTEWSDLLWELRGHDDIIDDEFIRYMEFITEVCEWRDARVGDTRQPLGSRARAVFGEQNPRRDLHLDFLFRAFDIWATHPIGETFARFFRAGTESAERVPDADSDERVRLFFRGAASSAGPPNLFEACCRSYGETSGQTRVFSLGQTVVLYAVLLHLIEDTDDFLHRVRVLRNLVEASTDELRTERMPQIVEDVHRLVRDGALDQVTALNQVQVADEQRKADVLRDHDELRASVYALEDDARLRGSLGAFDLEATDLFAARAAVFHDLMEAPEVWDDLLAALLACGEYQRSRGHSHRFLFGTNSKKHEGAWRDLLVGPPREALIDTGEVIAMLLDRLAGTGPSGLREVLRTLVDDFLSAREAAAQFDWRYYMAKYPEMREKGSSTYFAEPSPHVEPTAMGYCLCMLHAGGIRLSGYYRDPILLAVARRLDDPSVVEDQWFMGSETLPRRLPLKRSGVTIRCVPDGFELTAPELADDLARFEAACADLEIGADGHLPVPQVEVDGRPVDTVDRVDVGILVVQQLAAAGL